MVFVYGEKHISQWGDVLFVLQKRLTICRIRHIMKGEKK